MDRLVQALDTKPWNILSNYIYFLSGSSLSSASIVFSYLTIINQKPSQRVLHTYIVNTMPPLMISLPSRGTAPDQKVKIPSSLNIRTAHMKLFLYSFLASIDCILPKGQPSLFTGFWTSHLVLITSKGCVANLPKVRYTSTVRIARLTLL